MITQCSININESKNCNIVTEAMGVSLADIFKI